MASWCACSLQVLLLKDLVSWRANRASAVCIDVMLPGKYFEGVRQINQTYRSVIIIRTISYFEDKHYLPCIKSPVCKKSTRSKQMKASSLWQ